MEFYKATTAVLVVLLVIAGYLLITAKVTSCSTTVTLNATCNGSVIKVNSTANATPAFPGNIAGLAGDGAIFTGPNRNVQPVPEFPDKALPAAFIIAIIGAAVFLRRRSKK